MIFLDKLKKVLSIILWIILGLIFAYGISQIDRIGMSSTIILLLIIFFLFFKNIVLIEGKNNLRIYCIIFLIKFGLLIYDTAYKNLPMTSGDFQVYHMFANNILESTNGLFEILSLTSGTDFYSKINALAYSILENNWNIPYYLSFIYSLIISIYIYKSAIIITKSKEKSTLILLLWMITPMEIIYSITYLKESFMQMIFIISFYKVLSYLNQGKNIDMIFAIALAAINSMVHSGMISVLLVYGVFFSFYNFKYKKLTVTLKGIIILFIIGIIIFDSPAGSALMARFQGIETTEDLVEKTQTIAGNTTYISNTPSNLLDIALQTPYRFIMFFISPLPWQVKSMSTVIALVLDGILQYFILFFYIYYIFKLKFKTSEDKIYKILVVSILISTYLIYSWGTNNFGSAMRHRLKVYPMTIIIMYTYWSKIKGILNERRNNKNATINQRNNTNI